MSLIIFLIFWISLGVFIKIDVTTLGCRLSLATFAFRLAFGFLLLLGSLVVCNL